MNPYSRDRSAAGGGQGKNPPDLFLKQNKSKLLLREWQEIHSCLGPNPALTGKAEHQLGLHQVQGKDRLLLILVEAKAIFRGLYLCGSRTKSSSIPWFQQRLDASEGGTENLPLPPNFTLQ